MAQKDRATVVRKAPWVDVVFGTHNLGSLPVLLERARVLEQSQVEIVEALGSEAFAHGWLTSSGPTVIARLDAADARTVRPGSVIPLGAAPTAVHLFDASTDRALA